MGRIVKNHSIVGLSLIILSLATTSAVSSSKTPQWQGAIVYSGLFSLGSGVPVSHCHVLTNEHVVRGNKQAHVVIENDQHDGEIVAVSKDHDMALIKLEGCPIKVYASVAKDAPKKGDILTSIYAKAGFNFFHRSSTSKGVFKGFSNTLTEENKVIASMVIDDPRPQIGSSGGGVMSKGGLVSVIFSIASPFAKPETYAVDYFALKDFIAVNLRLSVNR